MSFASEIGTMYATWTDPTGQVWELTNVDDDSGWFTTNGPGGWGAVEYEIILDPLASGGGEPRFIRAESGRVTWPLYIAGDTHMEFLTRYRAIKRAILMTVHRGQLGVLRVARPDGSARELRCFYESGLRGEPGENWVKAQPVVTFLAPDGYWRDVEETVIEHSYVGTPVSFFDPFFTVSDSQVLGEATITNVGDVDAWPEWTITGPMTSIAATNHTTGKAFTLDHALTSGEQITIRTARPRPMVRGPADINLVGALNWPAAQLWPLIPDLNEIEFDVAGAAAGTKTQLRYFNRYDGA